MYGNTQREEPFDIPIHCLLLGKPTSNGGDSQFVRAPCERMTSTGKDYNVKIIQINCHYSFQKKRIGGRLF